MMDANRRTSRELTIKVADAYQRNPATIRGQKGLGICTPSNCAAGGVTKINPRPIFQIPDQKTNRSNVIRRPHEVQRGPTARSAKRRLAARFRHSTPRGISFIVSRLVWLLFQQIAQSHSISRDALDQFDEFDIEEDDPVARYDMDHARKGRRRR